MSLLWPSNRLEGVDSHGVLKWMLRCILHLKRCTQSPVTALRWGCSGASCSLTRSKSVTEHPLRQTVELVVQTWPCAPGSCGSRGRTVCMLIVTGLTNASSPPVKRHLMCVVLLQQSSKECHGVICMRHEQTNTTKDGVEAMIYQLLNV